uniref:protein-tyrosine-phosphatase n=1 Tax=Syphacia muris TaxID=451379 RepID=A0A0N5A8Q6_9BILA
MIEEVIPEENKNPAFAESIRQLGELGFEKPGSSKRTLADVTNRSIESPKLGFPLKSHSSETSFNLSKRYKKYYSDLAARNARKRSLDQTPTTFKKRRGIRSAGDRRIAKSEKPRSNWRSAPEVQSGDDAKNAPSRYQKLPNHLHVDYSLETLAKPQIDSTAFKSISGEVLAKVMTSMSEEEFSKKYILVDCRYPYEYEGGHLRGAVNIFDVSRLACMLFPESAEQFNEMTLKIPIFYCEFSQKRGPSMALALRELDRSRNRYPDVHYKEIYLLDRGYKKFFEDERLLASCNVLFENMHLQHLCEPQSYTRMVESNHKDDLKRFRMHKSKSMSAFSYASNAERELLKPRPRSNALSEMDLCNYRRRKQCSPSARRSIFGSPFSSKDFAVLDDTPLRPLDLSSCP